ncbi:unknown [Betafusellovirus yellowstonense]|uniref:Uncharacterized protein n=1 Tax=Betafusellovirus yellowstonense TaxID=693629 RepID=D1GF88_9VIRU|nr:hypothetical protein SSSV1_gp04 [Acidianus spindle-shaped virus 1]ACZ35790.1 unknown [Acidianus spindle-shaped virus 1]
MLEISKLYFLIGTVIDLISIFFLLLFRKSKPKTKTSNLDHRGIKRLGYYLIISSILVLVISHLVSFHNYISYFMGLSLMGLMFLIGMIMVTNHE